ncbi:MAG TPA: D-alanyl-D-alanine carboxypeptidase [Streptosporangiaceae bacterium]|nr:D-alanyl-D-alanine carboxypeptidase [Streptosporangiaceae bacterium]
MTLIRGIQAGRAGLLAACAAILIVVGAAPPALAQQGGPGAAQGGPQLGGHGIVVNYPAHGARKLPYVPADAYVIADATTGQVLAAKDPHGHLPPASTLKILTTDTLMPVLRPGQPVVTSHQAAAVEPSKVGLVQGRSYRVHDLFKALLLISANDAAIALAQATGSYRQGVTMMNAEAHHLRAYDTVAKTPNGLPARGQHTSAYDLALFARQAITMPEFRTIELMRETSFPLHARHSVTLWNQNLMLGRYPGDIGGKIGWTTASETTFIGWARRGGHTLIVTIMHCIPLTEMTYAAKLLTWGFAMDGRVRPVGVLVPPRATGHRPAVAHWPATGHRPAPGQTAARGAGHRIAGQARAASSVPAAGLAAGGGLLAAAVAAGGIVLAVRRPRRKGNPPGP